MQIFRIWLASEMVRRVIGLVTLSSQPMKLSFCFVGILASIASLNAYSDEYMDLLREDPRVPAHCRDVKIQSFSAARNYFVYGVQGSTRNGFSNEINLTREEASQLWFALKNGASEYEFLAQIRPERRLLLAEHFRFLVDEGARMGFDYGKEGDILEALALRDLEQVYPPNEFFTFGGVEYHHAGGHGALGELDLLVARRSDCAVLAVGEAKLGVGQLAHAKNQLGRIFEFVKSKLCPSSGRSLPICTVIVRGI